MLWRIILTLCIELGRTHKWPTMKLIPVYHLLVVFLNDIILLVHSASFCPRTLPFKQIVREVGIHPSIKEYFNRVSTFMEKARVGAFV